MATDVATWYRQAVVEAYAPALSLSVVIRHDPTFSRVYTLFNNSAPELFALVGGYTGHLLDVHGGW